MKHSSLFKLLAAFLLCSASAASQAAPDKLAVGVIPVPGDAPLQVAISEGIFREAGLDVTLKTAQGFGPNLASVLSGEIQVGFASSVPILVAASRGAPIQVVAVAEYTAQEAEKDPLTLMVRPDSGIDRPAALVGKTVALVALGSSDSVALKRCITQDGADASQVKLMEVGVADLLPSLEAGRVDAVFIAGPGRVRGNRVGMKEAFAPLSCGMPGLPQGAYFVNKAYAKANPELVKRFAQAINKASAAAMADPELVRGILPAFMNVPEDITRDIRLGNWRSDMSRKDWAQLADYVREAGLMTRLPDIDQLLLSED